jgi:hypothetical protein
MRAVDVTGADRLRQEDKVIRAVTEKLAEHRSQLGSSRHGMVKWRTDEKGKVRVELQLTY